VCALLLCVVCALCVIVVLCVYCLVSVWVFMLCASTSVVCVCVCVVCILSCDCLITHVLCAREGVCRAMCAWLLLLYTNKQHTQTK